MKNFLLFSVGAALFFLTACQTAPTGNISTDESALRAKHPGGFYFPQQIPTKRLESLHLDPAVIQRAVSHVGIFYITKKSSPTPKQREYWKERRCGEPGGRFFDSEYCRALESAQCEEKCEFVVSRVECTGVRWKNFFITNHHCLPPKGELRNPVVKFFAPNGSLISYPLEELPNTYHSMPNDLAAFRIKDFKSTEPKLEIADTTKLNEGDAVFGLGLPVLYLRKERAQSLDYPIFPFGLRATIGKVVDSNRDRKAYCTYTNEDDVTDVEKWKLEQDCSHVDYKKLNFSAQVQRDPVLTDTDMTFGMSGSPLFDKEGNLIGIGSNVLSNIPQYYQPGKWAIYVKAQYIKDMLQGI